MNVVILAAGQGKRMHSSLPKVLHPIGGRPMLEHVCRTAVDAGAERLTVVVGHGAEDVRAAVAGFNLPLQANQLCFALQDPPQGTGHAVAAAWPSLDPSLSLTLVLYGDVPLMRADVLKALVAAAEAQDQIAVLTAVVDDPTGYGRILRDSQGQVSGSVEERDATPTQRQLREINTGVLVAPTADLGRWVRGLQNNNAQAEYYLTDVIGMAVAEGRQVVGLPCKDPDAFLGVNNLVQRADLERRHQRRLAHDWLLAGIDIADPSRFDVRGSLHCEPGVRIDIGCVFEGSVVLRAGAQIGAYVVLRDVEVGPGARVEAFSHLDGAALGREAVVGPFARLRPGTRLAEGCHIGNFTEVKNSQIGPYSKANHLSYVGDSTVGARVNIGAGTITCNYDGAEKHRTIIEDDVFIGSDTQLVAPVVVHEGATLAAGTTLTSDAPAHQLTLSRARQASIPKWKRPQKKSH